MKANTLTFLVLFFAPLSLTAEILSMGGNFLPGNQLFWVYFVAAISIMLVVL